MGIEKRNTVRQLVWDLVFVIGALVFVCGLSMAWRPLGFIVGGMIISAIAFLVGYRRI